MIKRIAGLFAALALVVGGTLAGASPALAAGPYYWYAGGLQTSASATYTEAAANLTVNNPATSTAGGDHSIAEIALIRGTGSSRQILEIGWGTNVHNDGGTSTRLWVGAWKNNVWSGYNAPGVFVPWCSSSPCTTKQANDVLTSGGVSLSAKQFRIELVSGNWWFAYDLNWIGYIPASYFSGVSPAVTGFDQVKFFGEVASVTSNPTCTDMGDGSWPTSASGPYFGSSEVNGTGTVLTLFITDAAKYNAVFAGASTKSFRYGGPGPC